MRYIYEIHSTFRCTLGDARLYFKIKVCVQPLGLAPSVSGAADIRFLNNYGETRSVMFGPVSTDQSQVTNGYARIKGLISAAKTYASTVLDWCGVG
jgi:acetylornithine deacetylase/succinyl-diaminopimelate desuccinylase-like protein